MDVVVIVWGLGIGKLTHGQKYTKQFRGKQTSNDTADIYLKDFTWGEARQPKNLIPPYTIPGKWTYPAPGKIQWKTKA